MTTLIPKVDLMNGGTTPVGAINRPINQKLQEIRSVLDFGADPTGVADSTAAFNNALQATVAYSTALCYQVFVPAGTYKLDGTIYVRLGQSLVGAGAGNTILDLTGQLSSTDPAIRTAYGLISGSLVYDSGGQPVEISNLFLYGGSGVAPVISANAAGGYYHDNWFGNCGIGISAEAPETLIYNNIFDQGANGIYVKQVTVSIENNVFFNHTATGISIFAPTSDVQIVNNTFEFTQIASIYFVEGESGIGANIVANRFFLNVQHTTFQGFITYRSTTSKSYIRDCNFYNMKESAINGTLGTNDVTIQDCTFDGNKTLAAWAQSSTAWGVDASLLNATMTNVTFTNMYKTPIQFTGNEVRSLYWDGGRCLTDLSAIGTIGEVILLTNTSTSSKVTLLNIDAGGNYLHTLNSAVQIRRKGLLNWFGPVLNSAGKYIIKVPFEYANMYQVTVRANISSGSSLDYRNVSCILVEKNNSYTAPNALSFITQTTLLAGVAHDIGAISVTAEFTAPGGGTSVASTNSGWIVIYVPNTYDINYLNFDVENYL